MKTLNSIIITLSMLSSIQLVSQSEVDSTGLLGDHFSLEGALEVFKTSENLEDFEAAINNKDNAINNLDLNEDGETDYIRVEDNHDGDVHAIVLQAVLGKDESQDVAVIEIEKDSDESATLQMVGDELLYGKDHYVEPFEEQAESDGRGGPNAEYMLTRIVVNVWFWPSVRYVYGPRYRVYRSPFYWGYYPSIWKPWRPLTWRTYHVNRFHYTHRYRVVNTHRVVRAHKVYTPRRTTAKTVTVRSKTVTRVNRTNSKTTVTKTNTRTVAKTNSNGNVKVGKKTTTTGVTKDANGNVKVGQKTNTAGATRDANGNVKVGQKQTRTGVTKDADGNLKAGKQSRKRGGKQNANGNVTKGKSKSSTKRSNGKTTKKTKSVKRKKKG